MQATSLLLFKNGFGMIQRTIFLPSTENNNSIQEYRICDPPRHAVHGSLWIEPSDCELRSTHTEEYVVKSETHSCKNLEELISANVGSKVSLGRRNTNGGSIEWVQGTLSFVERKMKRRRKHSSSATPAPYGPYAQLSALTGVNAAQSQDEDYDDCFGNLVGLTTPEGLEAFPLSDVVSVRSADPKEPLKTTISREKGSNTLLVKYIPQGKNASILLKYLTGGITWAPSYQVELSANPEKKILKISAKAVILNDVEGIVAENVSCVAGFPNITFSNVKDPLTNVDTITQFVNSLSSVTSGKEQARANRGARGNVLVQQQVMYNAAYTGPGVTASDENSSAEPTSNSDLHFYNFTNVTLPRGERIYLPIFAMETKYCDVYHCDIDNANQNYYYNSPPTGQQQPYEDVWHAIQIHNTSKHVWTTAPATVFGEDGNFLAQDTLTYTQIGSSSMINLTKALDVKVSFEGATAIEQNKGVTYVLDHKYQKDTVKSQIIATNLKKEEVTVVIKVSTTGVLSKSNLPPTANVEEINYDVANPKRKLTWEVKIEPGKTVKINYERDILRRN